jgi:hypothetical protein
MMEQQILSIATISVSISVAPVDYSSSKEVFWFPFEGNPLKVSTHTRKD